MSYETIWIQGPMKARIWGAKDGGESPEWSEGLEIFVDNKLIATASEGEEIIRIEGDFQDWVEVGGEDPDFPGCPKMECRGFNLSIVDLRFIVQAVEDFNGESLDVIRWKETKVKE